MPTNTKWYGEKRGALWVKSLEKCRELFKQIDELNKQEKLAYGCSDLQEQGNTSSITREAIADKVSELNNTIHTAATKSRRRKATTLKNKLKETEHKIEKYNNQITKAGKRSGYNKTDPDASAMMMKNKVEELPAYNVLAGSEDQFITGVSVHQTTNDGVCLEDHLRQIAQQPCKPGRIIADSIFGTEQNYELLHKNEIEIYMKFPHYRKEQTRRYQQNIFLKENFPYDPLTDSYECPNGLRLAFKESTNKRINEPAINLY